MTKPAPPAAAVVWLLAATVIFAWGGNYSLQKEVMAVIGPSPFLVARYIATPMVLAGMMFAKYGRRWPRLMARDWAILAGLGLLGHVLQVSVMTHAMHLSTPFSSALISACGPVFTLLILRFTTAHRMERWQFIGVVVAAVGVLVFMSDKLRGGPGAQTAGDLLLLLGTLFFSMHTVAARDSIERLGVFVVMAYSTMLASVPMLLMNAAPAIELQWQQLPPRVWWELAGSLAASLAGWLTWSRLSVDLGVARTAPLLYLLPPVAGAIAWALVGESFTVAKIIGSLVALGGIAMVQFGGRLFGRVRTQTAAE